MHTLYIASLRNSTEFAFMKRFFMRMHVFPFLRNSTEFRGIFFVGVDVFMVCFDYVSRFRLNACIVPLRNSTEFAFMKRFFMRMHVLHFFHGILRNFEEYSLWEWMFFLVCFDFLRRFIDLMHALYLYGILRNLHLWRDYFHFLQYGFSRIFLALALISWGDSSLT